MDPLLQEIDQDPIFVALSPDRADFLLEGLDRYRTPSPEPVIIDGNLDGPSRCSCNPRCKVQEISCSEGNNGGVIYQPTVSGNPPLGTGPRFPRRTGLSRPIKPHRLTKRPTFPSVRTPTSESSAATKLHRSGGRQSSSPSRVSISGLSAVAKPHRPDDRRPSSPSLDSISGPSAVIQPHRSDDRRPSPSPQILTTELSAVTKPHRSDGQRSSSPSRALITELSAVARPHLPNDHRPSFPLQASTEPSAVKPDLSDGERSNSPSVPRKRKTRRGGRKVQLKRLLKSYYTEGCYAAESLSRPETTFPPQKNGNPATTSTHVVKGKPRIVHVQTTNIKIKVVRYQLKALDLPPIVYPANFSHLDPRYKVYVAKRRQVLYPQSRAKNRHSKNRSDRATNSRPV